MRKFKFGKFTFTLINHWLPEYYFLTSVNGQITKSTKPICQWFNWFYVNNRGAQAGNLLLTIVSFTFMLDWEKRRNETA